MSAFARYDFHRKLDAEGIGESWSATAFRLDGTSVDVVVTRFLPDVVPPQMQAALLADLEAARAVEHASLLLTFECAWLGDGCFVATERVTGRHLGALLAARKRFSPRAALHVASAVLRGLNAAHRRTPPLAHGDVRPANVLVLPAGVVKLGGLGTGGTAMRLGRLDLGHAAPEQLQGRPFDARSDVFGVGLLLHELLTGHVLGSPDADIPPPSALNLDLPADLDPLVLSLCERDRDRRFATALDAVEAIATWGMERGLVLRDEEGLAELVGDDVVFAGAPSTAMRILGTSAFAGFAAYSIDTEFRPIDREGEERRVRERVTRASTDPTVAALADLDVLDGEESVPVLEDIRDVEPDRGEITREATRETLLSEPPTRVSGEPPTATGPAVAVPAVAPVPAPRSIELILLGALLGGAFVAMLGGVAFAAWWFAG